MMLPDPESLACFLAAAELRNFRAAARRNALSPPAFGERIRKLEDLLGGPLFERTTRAVRLTERGVRLVPQARRCIEEARRCMEGAVVPFDLTLGTRFELGMSWIVPALGPLEVARPERTLHLRFGDSPELLAALRADRIDGLVSSFRLAEPAFDQAILHRETYVFVASPALVEATPLRGPEDAHRHRLLDIAADLPLFRYLLEAGPEAEDWPFASTCGLGTIGAIRARVCQGAGVAVLPTYFVTQDLQAGTLIRLCPDLPLNEDSFRLTWRRGHALASELRALAGELRERPLTG
jgi:DNA-binding transcriptional LysR family regulator